MRTMIMAFALAAIIAPLTPTLADPPHREHRGNGHDSRQDDDRHVDNGRHHGRDHRQKYRRDYRHYDYNRPDPRYGNYRADRYYTADSSYNSRRLQSGDRIYRGTDNRYYCRRNDGTTGLIIGGLIGGVLGDSIAPGGSRTLGTILGGGAGALVGRSIDRNGGEVTCR